jgi:hypothetical protein
MLYSIAVRLTKRLSPNATVEGMADNLLLREVFRPRPATAPWKPPFPIVSPFLLKMSSGANVFEISDIQEDEGDVVQ